VFSMTVATSSGLVGLNIDDITCEFAIRRGIGHRLYPRLHRAE
jgi:hypothetical protein